MFQRGGDAFNQKVDQSNTIRPLRSFYLRKDAQGNYEPKAIMHLHKFSEAVNVDIHEIKLRQPNGSDKFIQAICMNEFDKPCPCCMSGMNKSTVAIYKIYDFTQYTSQRDNQTKQVGVQPMLAKKTQQNFIASLASADPNQLFGKVVNYNRAGHNGKDWSVNFTPNQPTEQDLVNFQEHMKSYTNEEIINMFPITDEKTMESVLQMSLRGGAGTVNSNFSPNGGGSPQNTFNNNNGGGGMNFNPNNNGGGSAPNNGGGNFNPNNNGGGSTPNNGNGNMNFNPNNNGGGSAPNNNGQGNNGSFNPNNGGGNSYHVNNNSTGNYNHNTPDSNFDPNKGGSLAKEDPNLGGGQGNFMNETPNFDADDIPF